MAEMAETTPDDLTDVALTPPKKKRRVIVHKQTFLEEYKQKYPCFETSKKGAGHAYCGVCASDISVSHGGLSDLYRHVKTNKHIELAAISSCQSKISLFARKKDDMDVIKSEVIFSKFLIENNLPLAVSDDAGKMFRNMFPDSQIAKQYACARTKTTAIALSLANCDEKEIANIISTSPFSIATDGSNDYGDIKLYPIIVKYLDEQHSKIITTMLTLPECKGRSTGENIFKIMDSELQKRNIPWSNCLSFGADNASVMSGAHKGVISFIKRENKDVHFMGCPCHLIHLAAEKGANVLPVAIEDQLINIYYYLDKSSKRQMQLKELQTLYDVDVRKILKHVSTRWLSLGVCLERMLSQWKPLLEFFKEESKESRLANVAKPCSTQTKSEKKKSDRSDAGLAFMFKKDESSKKSSSAVQPAQTKSEKKKSDRSDAGLAFMFKKDESSKKSSSAVQPAQTKSEKKKSDRSDAGLAFMFKKDESSKKSSSAVQPAQTKSEKKKSDRSDAGLAFMFKKDESSKKSSSAVQPVKNNSKKVASASRKENSGALSQAKVQKQNASKKAERIYENLRSRNFKLYCLFLNNVVPVFDHVNQLLQNEKPCIHILHSSLEQLLQNILTRFVKPGPIANARSTTSVKYKTKENQKENENLTIGSEARAFIKDNPSLDLKDFYQAVRSYFGTVCDYMCKMFPFDDQVLINAAVADISKRQEMNFSSLSYFVDRFGIISEKLQETASIDKLESEFLAYQIHGLTKEILEADRADTAWFSIGEIVEKSTGNKQFMVLSRVMLNILTMFHSNTDCERIFSFVTKTKTKFRPNMDTDTLSAIVTHKVTMSSHKEKAWFSNPDKDVLRAAKSATYNMLNK